MHVSYIRDGLRRLPALAALLFITAQPVNAADVLLIFDDLTVTPINLVELRDGQVIHVDSQHGWQSVPLARCIGFLDEGSLITERTRSGVLQLVDGQVIPGSILSNAASTQNTIVWNHSWMSRIEVPLEQVSTVLVSPLASIPEPSESDVVVLSNGDRLQGLVLEIGNPVTIEVDESGDTISIPLERVHAIRLVTRPTQSDQQRVWFRDGSVLDVRNIRLSDDGLLRLTTALGADSIEAEMPLSRVAGVLFQPGALVPVASLRVLSVQGPPTRYLTPEPQASTGPEALELRDLELRGPLKVTWRLPEGATRFAARAVLPEAAYVWGDYELIVSVNNSERMRVQINRAQPVADINIELRDSAELSIELTEGAFGAIQDHLILRRGMLLVR